MLPDEAPTKPARKSPFRPVDGPRPKHGAHTLTRVLRGVPLDTIDQRSKVGRALRVLREDIVDQLGGDLNPTQRLLVDEVCRKAVIVRAVGEWLLKQESLVRQGKGGPELLRVVEQHDAMQRTLAGLLEKVGWSRVAKDAGWLRDIARDES